MAIYNPSVFKVNTIEEAKKIILTDEDNTSTKTRWEKETPVLASIIANEWSSVEGKTIVDYGCGIGRMSKALCEMGAFMVGVDMSPEMRKLAIEYVGNKNFIALSPEQFSIIVNGGFKCDGALAIWVLQHCLKPQEDIDLIKKSLNGGLMVMNNDSHLGRAVPVLIDGNKINKWYNDGIDLWKLLDDAFVYSKEYDVEPSLIGLKENYYRCVFYNCK